MINRIPALMLIALAPTLAFGAYSQVGSFLDFPEPYDVAEDLDQGALADLGITPSGYSQAFGSLTGNPDAPMADAGGSIYGSQTANFFFYEPINAVGLSVADIDFSFDDPVVVTLNAKDSTGLTVGEVSIVLDAANTFDEENEGARFIGLESDLPFQTVTLSIDSNNNTFLDTLTFGPVDAGGGCNAAPGGSSTALGLLAIGLGFALRRRRE